MDKLLLVTIGGLIGGVVSPILVEIYRNLHRKREWVRPREDLLKRMLSGDLTYRSLDSLSRTTGTSPEECRTLLIDLGARGGLLSDGREAWALISRAPLQQEFSAEIVRENLRALEEDEEEEEE